MRQAPPITPERLRALMKNAENELDAAAENLP